MVARVSKSIKILLECCVYTFDAIGNFLALLLIFMYVYSLLGMQLFAGRLKFDEHGQKIQVEVTDKSQLDALIIPRSNFDKISHSCITVFQIMIGERWNEIFYDCWRGSSELLASVYFISLIFFGNIIMMNLFLAMLIGNFERANLNSELKQVENTLSQLAPSIPSVKTKQAKRDDEEQEKIRSILRPSTDFTSSTPLNGKKKSMKFRLRQAKFMD